MEKTRVFGVNRPSQFRSNTHVFFRQCDWYIRGYSHQRRTFFSAANENLVSNIMVWLLGPLADEVLDASRSLSTEKTRNAAARLHA